MQQQCTAAAAAPGGARYAGKLPCAPPCRRRVWANAEGPQQQQQLSKGFSLLELSNALLPQTALVTGVKEGWRLAWQAMVRELAPQSKTGAYVRPTYSFQGRIGDASFPAESGRYHLYLGNACPWCHRVALALVLRGLARPSGGAGSAPHVTVSRLVDDPTKARRGGWVFGADSPDPLFGARDLWEVYDRLQPGWRGRCTAPLLVDKVSRRAVSNESADIVRVLNRLHLPGCTDVDLVPPHLEREIDQLNQLVYDAVANGAYKSGFATTQQAYDQAQEELWGALDQLERRLAGGGQGGAAQRFLFGDQVTEADVRLLPPLVRFDSVYSVTFKCSRRRIAHDYPALSAWMARMWRLHVDGSLLQVWDTVDVDGCRQSYSTNLFPLNASGIVHAGPTAADLGLVPLKGSAALQQAVPVESVAFRRAAPATVAVA